jgi:hypothetical protein
LGTRRTLTEHHIIDDRQLPIPGIRSQWIKSWCDRTSIPVESDEYLQRVQFWRSAWRPKRVRILLVAESHVAEQAGDLDVRIAFSNNILPDGFELPGFCQLVYCSRTSAGFGSVGVEVCQVITLLIPFPTAIDEVFY